MSLGLSLSARQSPRRPLSDRNPAIGAETTLVRSDVQASDHDTLTVHAASVYPACDAYEVIRDTATQVAPLTLNHNTLTVSSARALIHRSTPYGADHTIEPADAGYASSSNPMALAMRDDQDTHLTSLNFTHVGITPSGVVLTQQAVRR